MTSAARDNTGTGARADVLAFYKDLPFNYRADAAADAATIRSTDALQAYPPLVKVLGARPRMIDVGCGAGWLANSAAYHYGCAVTGIDFNPVAIERAQAVARALGIAVKFDVADLFGHRPSERFPLVTSVGVLHHTDDCIGALRRLATNVLAPRGHIFIGLYHRHGRRAFMDHFARLKAKGASDDALLEAFRALSGRPQGGRDETYLRSWFRDQVLHPHETVHTLEELLPVLDELGLELEATSINRFALLPSRAELFAAEAEMEDAGRAALEGGRYFPGFFVFLARAPA